MTFKRWLSAGALILAASLVNTVAPTQEITGAIQETTGLNKDEAKEPVKPADIAVPVPAEGAKPKRAARPVTKIDPKDGMLISSIGVAARTALCRQDCKPNNLQASGLGIHGHYRTYGQWDPELKSIEGRKQFNACVQRCLEPTPWFAVGQRAAIAMSGKFFGKTKEDCLTCHSKY